MKVSLLFMLLGGLTTVSFAAPNPVDQAIRACRRLKSVAYEMSLEQSLVQGDQHLLKSTWAYLDGHFYQKRRDPALTELETSYAGPEGYTSILYPRGTEADRRLCSASIASDLQEFAGLVWPLDGSYLIHGKPMAAILKSGRFRVTSQSSSARYGRLFIIEGSTGEGRTYRVMVSPAAGYLPVSTTETDPSGLNRLEFRITHVTRSDGLVLPTSVECHVLRKVGTGWSELTTNKADGVPSEVNSVPESLFDHPSPDQLPNGTRVNDLTHHRWYRVVNHQLRAETAFPNPRQTVDFALFTIAGSTRLTGLMGFPPRRRSNPKS